MSVDAYLCEEHSGQMNFISIHLEMMEPLAFSWSNIMATIWKVWCHIKNWTQSMHISWRTILPDFTLIRFEMMEPCCLNLFLKRSLQQEQEEEEEQHE